MPIQSREITDIFLSLTVVITALILSIIFYLVLKDYKKRMRIQSLSQGAIDEPRPLRNLTEDETKFIKTEIHKERLGLISLISSGISSLILMVVFYLSFGIDFKFFLFLLAFIFTIYYLVVFTSRHYYDLRSPVFALKGPVALFLSSTKNNKIESSFHVRNIRFAVNLEKKDYPRLSEPLYEQIINISEGDIVTVEYTPFTNTVLRISKH